MAHLAGLTAGRSSIEALGPGSVPPGAALAQPENHYRGPAQAPICAPEPGRGMLSVLYLIMVRGTWY